MNFTCLCFDLKYSFKINCCNLLHISFNIYRKSEAVVASWRWLTRLLIKARQTLDVTIYCVGQHWLIQHHHHHHHHWWHQSKVLWSGHLHHNCPTQITRPHCAGRAAPDAGHRPLLRPGDRTGGQKLTKEEFISGEIRWILSTNKDNGHYC